MVETDLVFASVMIQTLNVILLTSSELHDMRLNLKNLMIPESRDFFTVLYKYENCMSRARGWGW